MIKIDGGSTAQYGYGPQGERVWKIAGGVTTYFYWGIGEKVAGQWTKLYVQGLGGKLVEYSGGTTWFFATNHLGTIAARMNVSGTLMETYRFLPYGERYAGTHTPHQYTRKERDAESGLDYFGARYYTSTHGRWMRADPQIGNMRNPQRLNRYGYVLGDPVNRIDPDGRDDCDNFAETGHCTGGNTTVTVAADAGPPPPRAGNPHANGPVGVPGDVLDGSSPWRHMLRDTDPADEPSFAGNAHTTASGQSAGGEGSPAQSDSSRPELWLMRTCAFHIPGANHVYIYSPRERQGYGTNGSAGGPPGAVRGTPLGSRVATVELPDGMTEKEAIDLIRDYRGWNAPPYNPGGVLFPALPPNDCQSQACGALQDAGLKCPSIPNGRVSWDDWVIDEFKRPKPNIPILP